MRIGDIVQAHNGSIGLVIQTEMMYPKHPDSPVGRICVEWFDKTPDWWRPGQFFDAMAIKRVVSRASR